MKPVPVFDIQALRLALTPQVFYDIMYPAMDLDAEVEELEKQLRDLLIAHVKANKITIEKARALTRAYLAILPIKDQQDLLAKLKALGKEYEEARELYIKELRKVNEAKKDAALIHMREAIKQGDINKALAVAHVVYVN